MVKASPAHDLLLVERTLDGHFDAFEELVERHRMDVFRVAASIVGPDEADDVAQDAFLRAFHKLHTLRGDSFRSWLLRIAHNRALNVLARRKPDLVDPVEEPQRLEGEERPRQDPARSLEESERRARLASKLEQLRPAHRSVLVLRDLEGFSYEEIAEVTDSPLGSGNRAHRGACLRAGRARARPRDERRPLRRHGLRGGTGDHDPGLRGRIEAIEGASTVIATENGTSVRIPNHLFLESDVLVHGGTNQSS